jgi:hypothetical protein
MGEIHRLLTELGHQKVVQLDFPRDVIDTAAAYMRAEEAEIGFLYSGFAQAALPYKRLADDASWQVKTGYLTLFVQPGLRSGADGPIPVGVPYGSRARLICLYLQSEALRNNSREVELGKSLNAWLRRLGIPVGGKSYEAIREQAERISRCNISFEMERGDRAGLMRQDILDTSIFVRSDDSGVRGRFVEKASLTQRFFEQLKKHPVPIEETAISALANNPLAMDIYCWLAYRLRSLDKPTAISWRLLQPQFGASCTSFRDFKKNFKRPLALALSVYPDAKVDVEDFGLRLHPSRPPVSPKLVASVRRSA